MHLGTNVSLKGFTQVVRNVIMACYVAHLASGQTLLCRSIKTCTIRKYLKAASDLSIPFQMMNPTVDIQAKESKFIKDIMHEAHRWESMPKRREPITKDMVSFIRTKGSSLSLQDNIYTVMSDWLTLGLQTGFRRIEWAQDKTYLQLHHHVQHNVDGSPAAFIASDFAFRGPDGLRLPNDSIPKIEDISTVLITWRYQKNMDNGQSITYAKDPLNPTFCAVAAALRIITRTKRLKVASGNPIAVYVSHHHPITQCNYVDDTHISSLLREAAKSLYKIKDKAALNRFTAHSIRVGACVLLHANGINSETIQFRLRWHSDVFKFYLRNVDALAEQHRNVLRET